MINMWHNLLYRSPASSGSDYFLKSFPYGLAVCGAFLDVLLLGAVIFALMIGTEQRNSMFRMVSRLLVVALLFFVLDHVLLLVWSMFFGSSLTANGAGLSFIFALLISLIIYFLWDRKPGVGEIIRNSLLLLSPFVLITFGHAAWHLFQGDAAFADRAPAPFIQTRTGSPRVVWFIFDEMGQHETFEKDVKLPAMDRFRHESLYAVNAYPPGSWTIRSLPALFTGKRIRKAEPLGADELVITYCETGRKVKWSKEPNVFSRARRMGFNTAVIGGYHPYCRVINGDVTSCFWQPWDPFDGGLKNLRTTMVEHFRTSASIFGDLSHSVWSKRAKEIREEVLQGVLHEVQYHAGVYTSIMREARRVIADPRFGLIVVHWNVPHPPSIYDPSTRLLRDSRVNVTDSGYADNLVLADRTLGEMRRELEASQSWDSTTLIISSDHWLRKSLWRYEGETDHRIPFMLKLAGQKEGITYEKPFNTVVSQELILAILKSEITSADGVVAWLDGHESKADTSCGYQDDVE